ncbi:MAG: hypothetical protein JRJ62_15725 [Deltaproteobacteria bacterium]|nr:hypothetical protein [Deltaproteobacteria bacterium]
MKTIGRLVKLLSKRNTDISDRLDEEIKRRCAIIAWLFSSDPSPELRRRAGIEFVCHPKDVVITEEAIRRAKRIAGEGQKAPNEVMQEIKRGKRSK